MSSLYRFFLIFAPAALLVILACGQTDDTNRTGHAGFPREKTLYLAGFQWGEPNTFNPLSDWPAFPVGGNFNLMYEPLLVFNTLSGEIEPLLGKSFRQKDDSISVVIDPRARWSDGAPVVAGDVLFTYELGRRFKNAPSAYVWDYISKIAVDTIRSDMPGDTDGVAERITFIVNKQRNNPLVVTDILQTIRIVPRHVLEALLERAGGDLAAVQKLKIDDNPVVSGPYTLLNYSGEKIVLKRRDDYWGNNALYGGRLPRPEYIIHPVFKSNDHFSIALQQGNLDVSATFIPRIWLKAREGVRTWYAKEPFFVPAAMTMLVVNTTRYPLSDRNFRQAMVAAIDYDAIRELAFSGYSPPLRPGLILPFGMERSYFSEEDAAGGILYNPERAREILAAAGYVSVFDNKGNLEHMKNAGGEIVPTVYLKSPAGWTDWESMVTIAVKGLRAAGIDAREGFVDAGLYWQSIPSGEFDLLMHAPVPAVTPSKPWSRFEAVMSSRNWKPVGEKMNENQGRYNNPNDKNYNPEVDELLRRIPALVDESEKLDAYRALNRIFMQDLPALPLTYRPEQFYEFSIKHWTNFPTAENPYAPPQCLCFGAGTKSLWEIRPAGEK